MTGGYTILDLGGNVFKIGATADAAEGKTVEGIYDRIKGNNPNKPFLLENYSLTVDLEDTKGKAGFVHFSEVGDPWVVNKPFEARIDVGSKDSLNSCCVKVENNDTVKFFKLA